MASSALDVKRAASDATAGRLRPETDFEFGFMETPVAGNPTITSAGGAIAALADVWNTAVALACVSRTPIGICAPTAACHPIGEGLRANWRPFQTFWTVAFAKL